MENNGTTGDLKRFINAQSDGVFERALSEIKSGTKRTHWMWFVFPQYKGLGTSETSKLYAIQSPAEAKAYLEHPVLGVRLRECAEAMLGIEGRSAYEILGSPDEAKLHSCATLFARFSPPGSVFENVLTRYYNGKKDLKTSELLKE